MLWSKESVHQRLVYVNIFNDRFSVSLPVENNILYKKRKSETIKYLTAALQMKRIEENSENILKHINRALCFAPDGCKEIAMCYKLRSDCFYQMKKYSLSLADIKLAEENKFPFAQSKQRKEECLKSMNDRNEFRQLEILQLSFPADKKVSCFAEGLEVKKSTKFGSHIVTNRNLKIGQTVIIEEAFCITSDNVVNFSHCANCLNSEANLIPCRKCSAVMFCSKTCYDIGHEKFHRMQCSKPTIYKWETARRLVMLTVVKAIQTFSSIQSLMESIEEFNNRKSINNDLSPDDREYMQFFGLSNSIDRISPMLYVRFVTYTYNIYEEIISDPVFKSLFESLESSRFLAHLILHHFCIIDMNGFEALSLAHGAYTTELGTNTEYLNGIVYAHGIYLNSSQLNHSCKPNIARIYLKNKIICKVIRPIKSGEQLFVTYINPLNLLQPKIYRIERLAKIYYFKCDCSSCESLVEQDVVACDANDISTCPLVDMFKNSKGNINLNNCKVVNQEEMVKLEQSAIEYLSHLEQLKTLTAHALRVMLNSFEYSYKAPATLQLDLF